MYKRFSDKNLEVVATDLRALLFWATVGVNRSIDGTYSNEIENIIRSYSGHLGIRTNKPKFMSRKR